MNKSIFAAAMLLPIFIISTVHAQTVKKLDSLFYTLYQRGDLNGCVLVAEAGKPIYQKAFGYADFESKRVLNNQTMFELESVAKQFTAMAIMQLHQKGKLSYDDSLNKFFPQLPYHGITINHLIHHTSGISDFLKWGSDRIDINRINYNKDVLAGMTKKELKLNFKPGDAFAYSNINYVLLALIIEQVSGMSFNDYMTRYIFDPLGMKHTKVYAQRAAKQKIANYALGYVYDAAKQKLVISDSIPANRYQYYFDGVLGCDGISSTTEDLLKWDQALYTDKLINEAERQLADVPAKLNNGKEATYGGIPYGFGWLMLPYDSDRGKVYMHSGDGPGYLTIICRYPDKHKTVIILLNTYHLIEMYSLTSAVDAILFGDPFVIPKHVTP